MGIRIDEFIGMMADLGRSLAVDYSASGASIDCAAGCLTHTAGYKALLQKGLQVMLGWSGALCFAERQDVAPTNKQLTYLSGALDSYWCAHVYGVCGEMMEV